MLIGTHQKRSKFLDHGFPLFVSNQKLDNVTYEKILGVYLDNSLQYNVHIDHVCKTLSRKISALRRIKKYLPLQTRKLFYNAYIMPTIDYCLTIWGNTSRSNLDRVHKLQKRAARYILDAPPDAPSRPLFDELDWLTVYEQLTVNKYVLLYKSLFNYCPTYLHEMFKFQINNQYTLRSESNVDLCVPIHKCKLFENSFQHSGAILWNALPVHIKMSPTLNTFKKQVKLYVKQCQNNL